MSIKSELAAAASVVSNPSSNEASRVRSVVSKVSNENTDNVFTLTQAGEEFSYVRSKQELRAEFASIDRFVNSLIIHSTQSFTNNMLRAEDLDERERILGGQGIGYHYVILRNGSLQRGVTVQRSSRVGGSYASSGYDKDGIALAMVGGYETETNTGSFEEDDIGYTFTLEQYKTLDEIVATFISRYPGGNILGLSSIDLNRIEPGFDVTAYVQNKFGKR